jgi:hypothetical protein
VRYASAAGAPVTAIDAVRDTFTTLFELVESDPDAITVLFLAEQSAAVPKASGFAGARRRVIEQITERSRKRWSSIGVQLGRPPS